MKTLVEFIKLEINKGYSYSTIEECDYHNYDPEIQGYYMFLDKTFRDDLLGFLKCIKNVTLFYETFIWGASTDYIE